MARKLIYSTPPGFAKLTVNDVEDEGNGGRVVLTAQDMLKPPGTDESMFFAQLLQAVSITLNYVQDVAMRMWPVAKADRAKRRFTIEIWEEDVAEDGTIVKSKGTKTVPPAIPALSQDPGTT